ncbi:MAG TPA: ribbon-helix-helix domain-containing protein [Acidimicrobiales bacterium]|jgi:hypothetical protein|nr:ribbon-helix-helix domain-containing protein [Acidimicrobiales bacterium]
MVLSIEATEAQNTEAENMSDTDGAVMRKVTISMPEEMHAKLRRQARRRGITVTELMRRAVSLYEVLFDDPQNEVLLKKGDQIGRVISA